MIQYNISVVKSLSVVVLYCIGTDGMPLFQSNDSVRTNCCIKYEKNLDRRLTNNKKFW